MQARPSRPDVKHKVSSARIGRRMIVFVGPQGSGKTTQVRLLTKWLRKNKVRVRQAHIMNNHLLAFIFERILIRLGRYDYWVYPSGERLLKIDVRIEKRILNFWLLLQVLSLLLASFFRVQIWHWLGYTVIAERYFPDSIIHLKGIAEWHKSAHLPVARLINQLFRFIPRDSLVIFLGCDYQTLCRRYRNRRTPVEPKDYYQRYVALFDAMRKVIRPVCIDTGNTDIMTTFKIIREHMH